MSNYKEILDPPAGMWDEPQLICRHCRSSVSTVTAVCSVCGSSDVANNIGRYWENGQLKILSGFPRD